MTWRATLVTPRSGLAREIDVAVTWDDVASYVLTWRLTGAATERGVRGPRGAVLVHGLGIICRGQS